MERIDERFEFDESDIFGDSSPGPKDIAEEPPSDDESTDDEFPLASPHSARPIPTGSSHPRSTGLEAGPGPHGMGSGGAGAGGDSGKSSVLNVALDEDGCEQDTRRRGAVAQSLPAYNVQMGSSLPISIPHLRQWKPDGTAGPAGPMADMPATFVPPHQLSQRDDFMFSFTGASPSAAIKKERLRVRNAILKSTGFLEQQPGVTLPPPGLPMPTPARVVGGLSQALTLSGTPDQNGGGIAAAAGALGGRVAVA